MLIRASLPEDFDSELYEMLEGFLAEAYEELAASEPLVECLREVEHQKHAHTIFRSMHTLKGLATFLELTNIAHITQETELLLDAVRRTTTPPHDDVITLLYKSFDILRMLLNAVATTLKDNDTANIVPPHVVLLSAAVQDAQALYQAQQAAIRQQEPTGAVSSYSPSPNAATPPALHASAPASLDEEDLFVELHTPPSERSDVFSSLLNDGLIEKFVVEAAEFIARAEECCLRLEDHPTDEALIAELFGVIHSLKGNAGFMGQAVIGGLAAEIEDILDALRNHLLELTPNIISVLLANLDSLKREVSALNLAIMQNTPQSTAQSTTQNSAPNTQRDTPDVTETTSIAEQTGNQSPPPVLKPSQPSPEQTLETLNSAPPDTIETQAQTAQAPNFAPIQRKDIRVDTAKLDKLFDLIGELITTEAMLANSPDLQGLELQSFSKSASMLNKITRELQEVTTSIRMTPLEGLFTKMKRLVRDLALRLNKPASLLIAGAETEMDKNVIEELADPLMHLIRNALDHGIEPSADERRQAGKPEHATLRLEARYEGSEILIILADDGRGLDRQRILAKAAEQHLLKAQHAELYRSGRADAIADRDVWSYIFEPGFSTAERLSEISGRGVGMDVVRKNIEKLQGSISLHSSPGRGTTFTLRIPLTLAIMDGMLLRVGHNDEQTIYALPILTIRESFRPTHQQMHQTMDGLEMLTVRGEVYPVIRLHELFGKEPQTRHLYEGIVIMAEAVVQGEPRRVCLFVDEIVGQQQIVVKGLSDYIGSVDGITGCMILSNGEIGLILDLEAIIRKAERREQPTS
jgi:two-component system chemotaxis sensor kinase CheA